MEEGKEARMLVALEKDSQGQAGNVQDTAQQNGRAGSAGTETLLPMPPTVGLPWTGT